MKRMRWIALVLALVMLLTGCSGKTFEQLWNEWATLSVTPFSEMEYTRPDPAEMEAELKQCLSMAEGDTTKDALMEQIWVVYNLYNSFYTNYSLANIYYFRDLTDTKWETEYNFCLQNAANVDAMLEEMFYALADCPLREELEADPAIGEGFFDDYEGESIWDETFLALVEEEARLEEQYYELCTLAQNVEYYSEEFFATYGTKMAQNYVDLIAVRQKMAKHAGYEDYLTFAYDFYHYRDYTPTQAISYLQEIGRELVPLYRQTGNASGANKLCKESQTFAYVESSAKAMGGTIYTAFQAMADAKLYDITYSNKKYNSSFEVYLMDYTSPYVFVNPTGYVNDKLTFTHEFGHFCSDFAAAGSYAGVDVAEVFSQGLEYLSLCYGDEAGDLTELKMTDSLFVYVEQAAYALFEHQAYGLEGEELTVENVFALYETVGKQFGFDEWAWDSRDFVLINHFFTEPLYVISYVVSNDAALQLYQMEQANPGSGLKLYEEQLATAESYFLAFVNAAGLKDPFAPGRVAEVRATLEAVLG